MEELAYIKHSILKVQFYSRLDSRQELKISQLLMSKDICIILWVEAHTIPLALRRHLPDRWDSETLL